MWLPLVDLDSVGGNLTSSMASSTNLMIASSLGTAWSFVVWSDSSTVSGILPGWFSFAKGPTSPWIWWLIVFLVVWDSGKLWKTRELLPSFAGRWGPMLSLEEAPLCCCRYLRLPPETSSSEWTLAGFSANWFIHWNLSRVLARISRCSASNFELLAGCYLNNETLAGHACVKWRWQRVDLGECPWERW